MSNEGSPSLSAECKKTVSSIKKKKNHQPKHFRRDGFAVETFRLDFFMHFFLEFV